MNKPYAQDAKAHNVLVKMNHAFLSLGPDYQKNISILTDVCGELLGACAAIYNKLEGNLLISQGHWNTPLDYVPIDKPEGHICYDLIKTVAENNVCIIPNLSATNYKKTDPNVERYGLETYIGHPVYVGNQPVGALCAVYKNHRKFDNDEKYLLEILAKAISIEEERQAARQEVLLQQEHLAALFKNTTDAIVYFNTEERIESINQQFSTTFGYTPEEVKGELIDELVLSSQIDQARLFTRKILQGLAETIETIRYTKEMAPVHVIIKGVPVIIGGKVTGGYCIYTDITVIKTAEEKVYSYAADIELQSIELESAYNKIMDDIQKAHRIHQQFFPRDFPAVPGIEFAAYYKPAKDLGGDFYNVIQFKDKLLIYLVDVTGHGLDGAMLNIFVRETINSWLVQGKVLSPSKILEYLVEQYRTERFPTDYFISIFIGVVDGQKGQLIYSNAGLQIPPVAICNKGQLTALLNGGLPISNVIDKELLTYEDHYFSLRPGMVVFFSTDGLVEEMVADRMYGEERLRRVLLRNHQLPPELIVQAINGDFQSFTGTNEGSDDITYLLMKIHPENTKEETIKFYSKGEEVEAALVAVDKFFRDNFQDYHGMYIGFYEMISNALEHGNKFNADKLITIKLILSKKYLQLEISDEGEGFDWTRQIGNELEVFSYAERGRGIAIAKQCFDQVFYNATGSKVFLVKMLN